MLHKLMLTAVLCMSVRAACSPEALGRPRGGFVSVLQFKHTFKKRKTRSHSVANRFSLLFYVVSYGTTLSRESC